MEFSQIDTYSQEELEDILDEACETYYNAKKIKGKNLKMDN